MKLKSKEEQVTFLKKLYGNIERIYKQNLTDSDHKWFAPSEKFNGEQRYVLAKSGSAKLTNELPGALEMKSSTSVIDFSIKFAKLRLLIALYNTVEARTHTNDFLDLDDVFEKFKGNFNDVRVNFNEWKTAEQVLKTQRRTAQREGKFFASFLNFFIGKPKSEQFLEKYDFFKNDATKSQNDAVKYSA